MAGGADKPDVEATTGRRPTACHRARRHRSPCSSPLYMWSTWAFVFVVGLLISIFLHELGHFVTARWTGMKATQFFLFMGPSCGASVAARPSTACAPTRSAPSCGSSG